MELKSVETLHLYERPEFMPVLARWYMDEWQHWYGRGGPGDARKDLNECAARDALPLCLIAIDNRNRLLGTVALKERSAGYDLDDGPWMAALLVDLHFQGRGVGPVLIEAIASEARHLGFETIYTSGAPDDAVFQSQGWAPYDGGAASHGSRIIYARALGTDGTAH